MDAASLCGKKEALQEERQRLLQQLEKEEAAAAAVAAKSGSGSGSGGKAAGEGAQEDSLDAFMSGVLMDAVLGQRLWRSAAGGWVGRRTEALRMAWKHVVPLVGAARLPVLMRQLTADTTSTLPLQTWRCS